MQERSFRCLPFFFFLFFFFFVFVFVFLFCFFLNGALSAKKTIAELWDGRLRGGGIDLVCAAEGRVVSPGVLARVASKLARKRTGFWRHITSTSPGAD